MERASFSKRSLKQTHFPYTTLSIFLQVHCNTFDQELILHVHFSGFSIPKIPGCRQPLGMESGQISNASITVSTYTPQLYDPWSVYEIGRLLRKGGWVPKILDQRQWLQVDFGEEKQVTGIFYSRLFRF